MKNYSQSDGDGCAVGAPACEDCPLPDCLYSPEQNLDSPMGDARDRAAAAKLNVGLYGDVLILTSTRDSLPDVARRLGIRFVVAHYRKRKLLADPSLMLGRSVNYEFNEKVMGVLHGDD